LGGGGNVKVEDVKKDLGDDAELFDFEEKDGVVAAKLKNRVDKKEFSRLAQLVKDVGGEYVPFDYGTKQGAYFRFKKEEAVSTATLDKKDLPVKDAIAYAETVRTQLGYFIEKLKELQK